MLHALWGVDGSHWEENSQVLEEFLWGLGVVDCKQSRDSVRHFMQDVKTKWRLAKRSRSIFWERYRGWINETKSFRINSSRAEVSREYARDISTLTFRAKCKGTESIRDKYSMAELSAALEVAYYKAGHRSAGKLVRQIRCLIFGGDKA